MLCADIQAQTKSGVKLFKGTYNEAVREAAATGKYLFVYNRPADHDSYLFHFKADKELSERWNGRFVTVEKRYGLMEPPAGFLRDHYIISPSSGGIILDTAGNLLMQTGTVNTPEKLTQVLDKTESLEILPRIAVHKVQFEEGQRNKTFLKKYLIEQDSLNMHTNQQALLAYVNQLQISELGNFETVLFLMKCGPLLNGQVHYLANLNKLADSIFRSQPTSVRSRIRNRMIQHTLSEAIAKNDRSMLQAVNQYIQTNLYRHPARAQLAQNHYTMRFYRFRRDTAMYLQSVRTNCDGFFMKIPPDSLAKMDYAVRIGKTYSNYRKQPLFDSVQNSLYEEKYKRVGVKAVSRYYAGSLYHGAYAFSQLAADDNEHLLTAIGWLKRAISYRSDVAAYHHTLATLLQKAGFIHEALITQQTALKTAKKAGMNPTRFEEQLKRLQAAVKERPKVRSDADGQPEESRYEPEAG